MKTQRIIFTLFLIGTVFGGSDLFASCNVIGEHGNGNVIKQDRPVSGFVGIDISGAFDVYLKQGETESCAIEADENLQSAIITEVTGKTLKIYLNKPIHHCTTMKAFITVKDLRYIEISGASNIKTENTLDVNELQIESSGASDSEMDLKVQTLNIDCSGASKLEFSGTAGTVTADLSGACDIFAFGFTTENFILSLSGAGEAEITVTKKIQAEISGAGSVRYKGNPTIVDKWVSGAASMKKVD